MIAAQKEGTVIAASIWGKLKTVTQMIAIVLLFLDSISYGAIFYNKLDGFTFILNGLTTLIMSMAIICTVFSGIDYLKGAKKLLKE